MCEFYVKKNVSNFKVFTFEVQSIIINLKFKVKKENFVI